jgi:8-oxo-dGTP diphosphatase
MAGYGDGQGSAVRAAGGVVWRPGPDGEAEFAVVHRPRYDDWSLPKGKLDPGEHPLAAAVREVVEETGASAVPQMRLPTIRYALPGGGEKRVEYWAMRCREVAQRQPDEEVDLVAWLPRAQARDRLTYDHDRAVLAGLRPVAAALVLVRHAGAGQRGNWPGPDVERPLDEAGRADAEALCRLLGGFGPLRLVSAEPARCVQTIERLGEVALDGRFDEDADPAQAVTALRGLLPPAAPAAAARPAAAADSAAHPAAPLPVVCSQGKLIPPLLARLTGGPEARYRTPKGHGWLLAFSPDATLLAADPFAPRAAAEG